MFSILLCENCINMEKMKQQFQTNTKLFLVFGWFTEISTELKAQNTIITIDAKALMVLFQYYNLRQFCIICVVQVNLNLTTMLNVNLLGEHSRYKTTIYGLWWGLLCCTLDWTGIFYYDTFISSRHTKWFPCVSYLTRKCYHIIEILPSRNPANFCKQYYSECFCI